MKTEDQNPIDELFRSELGSFTLPLTGTVTAATIATVAAKKGLFAKLALLPVHSAVTISVAATTLGGIGYGSVKAYQFFTKPTQVQQTIQPQPQIQQPKTDTFFMADSLQVLDETDKSTENIENKNSHNNTTSQSNTPHTTQEIKVPANTSTLQAAETNNLPVASQVDATSDTVQTQKAVVKKVVYVQQPKVVVQDTVIKVVKKKKK